MAQAPWPAEPWSSATNLTSVEGPGTNEFFVDLSGAFWNPQTRRLWVCRNGPGGTSSKLWRLRESATGGWEVDQEGDGRAEWTGFGDFEAITQADLSSNSVLAMVEGEEVIKQFALGSSGVPVHVRTWNTRSHLPLDGGSGSEGIAFVPDAHLRAAGFVDGTGTPRVSTRGMGGLVFVGHQNGGRVYVFDLDAVSSALTFVGAYATGASETAELFFDRSSGELFVLHGEVNTIEVVSLESVVAGSERRLIQRELYMQPTGAPGTPNLEGLAVFDLPSCVARRRSVFLTVDDGGATSLLWFKQWPCACRADFNRSGTVTVQDLFEFLAAYFEGLPRADFNFSGELGVQDIFDMLAGYFACE